MKKTILLSFDIEEFDVPLEYGRQISLDEQIAISRKGLDEILKIIDYLNIKASFYSTVTFARENQQLLISMIRNGHEIASHNYNHKNNVDIDVFTSRSELESICGSMVYGFRMPQLQPVDNSLLVKYGYTYNSSINPTFIPGRYNHLRSPRRIYSHNNLIQLPVSVTPWFRIPLFWLSFHNFPLTLYKFLSKQTISKDNYLHLYFHPWEFIDLTDKERYNLPGYISKNSGIKMSMRFKNLLKWALDNNYCFSTTIDFIRETKMTN